MSQSTREQRVRSAPTEGRVWPTSRNEQVEEYDRRESATLGESYNQGEARTYGLFTARDTKGNVLIPPRRLSPHTAFVCRVDAAAIATDGVMLTLREDATTPGTGGPAASVRETMLEAAKAIWRRSKILDRLEETARMYCRGAIGFAAIARDDGRAVIVAYDPRNYTYRRDQYGLDITRVTIDLPYDEADMVDPESGSISPGQRKTYRQLMEAEQIRTWVDRVAAPDQSGANLLGVVPFAEAQFAPGRGGMPDWAGGQIDELVAAFNSLLTQGLAMGGRNANPLLHYSGVMAPSNDKSGQLDTTVETHADGKVQWVEAGMSGARFLVELATAITTVIERTCPEFLFMEAGAASSGTALSYRAGAFVSKITPIRNRFYRALAEVTAYAVAIELGMPWGETMDLFEVDGGSPLQIDVSAVLDNVHEQLARRTITLEDAVARLQSVGLIRDDVSAEEYAEQLRNSDREAAAEAAALVGRASNAAPEAEPGEVAEESEADV
jgi:hypothetical protein